MILKLGSRGIAVSELQHQLNHLGFGPLNVDKQFGQKTHDAVIALQEKFGLVPDGKVGEQTRTAMKRALEPVKARRPEPDKSAMNERPASGSTATPQEAPPPNVASLKLLDTARPIDEIFIHCAATAEGVNYTVADIRAWHKARGWSDIGYHYVLYLDGSILLGRPVGQIGSHVSGHNTGTIGICYVGGVAKNGKTAKDTRTPAQRSSLLWLTRQLVRKHGIKRVRGHNEVAAKACPSFIVADDALGKVV